MVSISNQWRMLMRRWTFRENQIQHIIAWLTWFEMTSAENKKQRMDMSGERKENTERGEETKEKSKKKRKEWWKLKLELECHWWTLFEMQTTSDANTFQFNPAVIFETWNISTSFRGHWSGIVVVVCCVRHAQKHGCSFLFLQKSLLITRAHILF